MHYTNFGICCSFFNQVIFQVLKNIHRARYWERSKINFWDGVSLWIKYKWLKFMIEPTQYKSFNEFALQIIRHANLMIIFRDHWHGHCCTQLFRNWNHPLLAPNSPKWLRSKVLWWEPKNYCTTIQPSLSPHKIHNYCKQVDRLDMRLIGT